MPICTHKHDKRSKMCYTCRFKYNHPRLNTGKDWSLHSSGYMTKCINGKWTLQHRHIMEEHLGRKLHRWEHVHHKNHNKVDNRIENLEVLDATTHAREHIKDRAKEMSVLGHLKRWKYVSNL